MSHGVWLFLRSKKCLTLFRRAAASRALRMTLTFAVRHLLVSGLFRAPPHGAHRRKNMKLLPLAALIAALVFACPLWAGDKEGAEEPALKTKLNKGLFSWATEDGKFSFEMNFRTQFRLTYSDERGADAEGASDPNSANASNGRDFWNFRVRRAKLSFKGNIFEKEFKYNVTLGLTNNAAELVETVFFTWARFREFNVNAGQELVPANFEQLASSGKQQFVDRSVLNAMFNQSRSKGIWFTGTIGGDTPWLRYAAGLFNGVLRSNGDFRNNDQAVTSDTFSQAIDADFTPALRLETHPLGEVPLDMVDMRDRDASRKVLFSFGVAVNWFASRLNNAALRTVSASPGSGRFDTGQDTLHFMIDGHLRVFGLSVNAEFHYRHTEFHNFGPRQGNGIARNRNRPGDLTDTGFSLMAGFFILPKRFDVALRLAMVDADEFWLNGSSSKPNGLAPDTTEIGLALGYYLAGHNLKIQADFNYYTFQMVSFITGSPNNAVTGSANDPRSASSIANDQSDWLNVWQFRVQLQWIF
jgi:hypothetical protein